NVFANANKELTNYFKDQINSLNQSVVATEATAPAVHPESDQMWYLNQFMLRLRAPLGFKIDGLASFSIIPEAEFVWQRANPEGWTNYKPL
ncbi:MAG: hypothetical protein ACXVLQ_04465, partial [Bacteriovorax sp.]